MKIPLIDKRNYKKVLRDLDISQFPSLPDFLLDYRKKLLNKQNTDFTLDIRAFAKFKKYLSDIETEINNYTLQSIDWDTLKGRPPYPFQKDGIKFLIQNNRCILADDMGLGKSIQSIIASKFLPEEYNILIITLKTLKYNFKVEVEYFDNRISIINTEDKVFKPDKYTIIHFDAIKKWHKEISNCRFDVIIIDEAHKFRNTKTQRYKAFKEVLDDSKRDIKKIWLLTGTPIDNKPLDYYTLLSMIKHPLSKNWIKYVERFCNGYKDMWGNWNTSGSSNLDELYLETKNSILRRTKLQVAKDLPNKERKPVWLELKNKTGLEKVFDDYVKNKISLFEEEDKELIEKNIQINEITKFMLGRQFLAIEKIKDGSTFELIDNEIDKGNKIILFTNFTKVIDLVSEHYKDKCLSLDGRVKKSEDRLALVDRFNKDSDISLFVVNWTVGSVGLNIQSANSVIANDMNLVPSTMVQGEDRAYRIGQTRDVLAQYLLYKDTIEEYIYEIISEKMQIVTQIVDGKKENYFKEYVENEEKNDKNSILKQIFAKIDKL